MSCTDRRVPVPWRHWGAAAGLGLLTACSPSPPPAGAASAAGGASTAASVGGTSPVGGAASVNSASSLGSAPNAAGASSAGAASPSHPAASPQPRSTLLAPPTAIARTWADYRRRAAQRLVDANPGRSHVGPVHEPLLAVPVLQIDLHADGSVQRIGVLRHPHFARDTTKLAEDAVRRAAPFGPVAHLPKPWRYTETFLFDEDRRFKPRTLDE